MNLKKKTTTVGETVSISYAHGEADFSDLVHVVRCRDCKHGGTANYFRGVGCWLTLDDKGNPRIINDGDGYCWRGEK